MNAARRKRVERARARRRAAHERRGTRCAESANRRRLGQRRHRGPAARARHPVHRADAGCELPRLARQPGQPPRQHAAGNAAVPARGARGRARARLCARHRPAARGRAACERRADARDDGDLQRLVRPHSDPAPRRRRPDRRRQAPAMGRLDPHDARPGRAGARLCQVGRSAGIGGRRARSDPARPSHRADLAAGTRLRLARRRAAGRGAGRARPAARARPLSRNRCPARHRRRRCARPRACSKAASAR